MFKALLVAKDDDGKTSASVTEISDDHVPKGDVTVAVEYSTVNYRDGICIGPGGVDYIDNGRSEGAKIVVGGRGLRGSEE